MTDEEAEKTGRIVAGCSADVAFVAAVAIAPYLWCCCRGTEYKWQYSAFAVCVSIVLCHIVATVCGALLKRRKGGE